jgi:hypothetical protein
LNREIELLMENPQRNFPLTNFCLDPSKVCLFFTICNYKLNTFFFETEARLSWSYIKENRKVFTISPKKVKEKETRETREENIKETHTK